MNPIDIKTKIFLDSGSYNDTQDVLNILGFLDGQTTNPSLIAKNSDISSRINKGEKYTQEELYLAYKQIIQRIKTMLPNGDVSIEVYSNKDTKSENIIKQATDMATWIENPFIKIPITSEGLKAAEYLVNEGINVNMTLCFKQEQAAAVYAATRNSSGAKVFLSPFEGRLDDIGKDGMDLISNILDLYKLGDGHVKVLAASIRDVKHLMYSIYLGVDAVTVPKIYLIEWFNNGKPLISDDFPFQNNPINENSYLHGSENIEDIYTKNIDLNKNWTEYDLNHPLTDKGIEKFAKDWNSLLVYNPIS